VPEVSVEGSSVLVPAAPPARPFPVLAPRPTVPVSVPAPVDPLPLPVVGCGSVVGLVGSEGVGVGPGSVVGLVGSEGVGVGPGSVVGDVVGGVVTFAGVDGLTLLGPAVSGASGTPLAAQ
jgi:hypothetical protein